MAWLTGRYLIAAVLAAAFLLPFVWMVALSVKSVGDFYRYPPTLTTDNPHWSNFATVLLDFSLLRYLGNSLFTTLAATLLQLICASMAAFAIVVLSFRGKSKIFGIFLGSMMVPSMVIIIPLFIVVNRLGWVDSYAALIIPFAFSGFGIFLLRQFFLSIPRDLFDAARIDGANTFRLYWNICLPLARPALSTLFALHFVAFWNSLIWPLIVINDDAKKTLPVGIVGLSTAQSANPNLVLAGVTIAVVPAVILFLLLQRYLMRGLVLSSGLRG